jgi:translation initiation factor 1
MKNDSNKDINKGLNKGLGGLAALAQLSSLVVKDTPPVSTADLAAQVKAITQARADAQKAIDVVRVSRETKGRGGKAVTLVKGISLPDKDLDALGKQLKASCGSGGTVKDGVIEVQGDHIDRVVLLLVAQGYKAKRAGG